MKNEKLKIGIFDSGLGGLTVVKALSQVIKGADIFYIADTKNAPYGEKTPKLILQYSLDITKHLIDTYHIDVLILACNTATAFAIKVLRKRHPKLIIIGTEPGIKPAICLSKTGNIGVLATPATLNADKYLHLVQMLSQGKNVKLYEQDCPGLVEQIEKGEVRSYKTKKMLEKWLTPMKNSGVDTIVLGCTHYPLVTELIEEIMSCELNIVETGEAIAKHLLVRSQEDGHINDGTLTINIESTDSINMELVNSMIPNYTLLYSL